MGQSLNKTKHRITSIKNTQKITKAMEMISSVKLRKIKNKFEESSIFLKSLVSLVYSVMKEVDMPFDKQLYMFKENRESDKDLYIIVNSTLGLCGSYNNEVIRKVDEIVKKEDDLMCIGSKAISHYKELYNGVDDTFQFISDKFKINDVEAILKLIKENYQNKKYRKIFIIYTKYINSIKYEVTSSQIFPVKKENLTANEESSFVNGITLFEPNKLDILEEAISLYLSTFILNCLYSSLVSEFASRRMAMENANDNADEILYKLNLEYNKARQAQITNEIIEVISGSNALSKLGG